MDNLLATTVKFFLVPEATLSAIFLVIFVVFFGLGIFWERQCRAELNDLAATGEEKFDALRAKMSPDLFIKKYLRKISAGEGKLEELPNVFVSIGIVATFLGLGVAIQGAAELLQTDKLELAKLTAVLGVIAFKFQTSVWGICCSLIFRRAVVERYFEYRQEVVDDLYDRLYSVERESIRTLLERQNNFLAAHLDWQKTFEDERLARQTAQHETLLASTNKINDTLEFLLDNFERFTDTASNFEKRASDFAAAVNDFSGVVSAFKVELTDILRTEFAELKEINEKFSRLQTEHIEKVHGEISTNMNQTTAKLDELHRQFYLDARKFIEETQQAFDKIIRETTGTVHDEYSREAHEIRLTVAALNSTLENIQTTVTNLNHEFTDEQKKFFAAWQTHFEKMSAAAENDSAKLDNAQKILLGIANGINLSQENLAANFKTFTDATTANLASLAQENAAARKALAENSADNFARLDNAQQSFLEIVEELKNATAANLANLAQENAAARKALAQNSADNFARLDNAQQSFLEIVEELKNATAANFSSLMQKNLLAVKSELEEITAGINSNALKISSVHENNLQEILLLQRQILDTLNKILEKSAVPAPPVKIEKDLLPSTKIDTIRRKIR